MQKITEKEVAQSLLDDAHVLITQQAEDADGQTSESLRRSPLSVLIEKLRSVLIDDTLSVAWEAADAAKVGEQLTTVKSYMYGAEKIVRYITSADVSLAVDTVARTVTVSAGYLFYKAERIPVEQTTVSLLSNSTSVHNVIVYDTGTASVRCVQIKEFAGETMYIIAILWNGHLTDPSSNCVPGKWSVDGVVVGEVVETVDTVYVSTDGDDSASGGRDAPLKTINKAIAIGAKTILVMAGQYKETVYLSDPGRELEIIAKPLSYTDKDVVIDLGVSLELAEDSTTGLVKAAYASTEDDFIYKAFVTQYETLIYADSFITDGYACNLWSGDTKLVPVLTLAECQATEGTWFYDGSYVYANSTAGTYTLDDGETEYGIYLAGLSKVELTGIAVRHARKDAVRVQSCSDVRICRCSFSRAGLYNGLALENVNAVVRDCRAMYNRTDGLNIHGVGTADFVDCVSHDNGDDGISHHDESGGMVIGGEYYRNVKGGVCSPTFGSRNTVSGVYIHDNGTGVYAVTSEDGDYPECTVSNCLIEDNDVGIRASRYTLHCWGNVLSGNTEVTKTENGGVIDMWGTDRTLTLPGRAADAEQVGALFTSQKRRISGYLHTNSYIAIDATARTIAFGTQSFVTWGTEKIDVSGNVYALAEDLKWGGYLFYDPSGNTFVKTYSDGYVFVGALWWPYWRHELHTERDKVMVDGMPILYTARYLDKKCNCLGDSMTDTAITSEPYCKWLPQLLGFDKNEVVNYGVGGSSISPKVDAVPTWDTEASFLERYAEMDDDADVVIVFGGVNDWVTGRTLGSISDTGTDTFCGAMKALCEGLIAKYPTGSIYVFSSPQNDHVHRPATDLTGTEWAGNTEGYNRKGHKLIDYVSAMEQICGMYGIPFCDMTTGLWWGLSGVLGVYQGNEDGTHKAGTYGADSLHPNAEGHKKIALKMAGFINSN